MDEIYKDPIIKKYFDLIKAKMESKFKMYYQGDPIRIPKSGIPALIISKRETQIGHLNSSEDEQQMRIVLTVVCDIRDEINDDKEFVPGMAMLYNLVEGRDPSTYQLKDDTILDILRTNELVDASLNLRTDLGSVTKADYGITIGKRDQKEVSYAIEATVEFTAYFTQIR